MGGKAIKTVPITRMNKNIYKQIENDVLNVLRKYYSHATTIIPKPEKEDFGDIDILYVGHDIDIVDIIKKEFNPIEIAVNGLSMCSIAYNIDNMYYQIDFIKCDSVSQYTASEFYYSYGDLGGIIGRMTNYAGIKFGHDGLWLYYAPSGNTNMNAICVHLTYEVEKICNFLNLDYDLYNKGFNTVNKVFDWICSSNYFYTDIFDYDKLNHDHKKRTIKRPMYQQFVDYIKDFNKPHLTDQFEYVKLKQEEALNYFSKKDYLTEQLNILTRKQLIKEKFNGKLFIDLDIDIKQITLYTEKFKIYIIDKYKILFEEYIIDNSKDSIIGEVKLFVSLI